jgi:hypothetical protein
MTQRGDCLCCSRIGNCRLVTVKKAISGFTCHMFTEVEESVWMARWDAMQTFGETITIQSMMKTDDTPEEK